jgi:hypothetical protein
MAAEALRLFNRGQAELMETSEMVLVLAVFAKNLSE